MQATPIKEFGAETYRIIAEKDEFAIFEWNLLTDEIYCDKNLLNILGETLPKNDFSRNIIDSGTVHPDDIEMVKNFVDFLFKPHSRLADQEYQLVWDYRLRDKSGQYVWIRALFVVYFKGNMAYRVIGSLRNIDSQRKMTEKLKLEAEHDSLTGLYNKLYLKKAIEVILSSPDEKHALLVIDLDGFKAVNDTFGHLFGDAVITDAALKISDAFRKSDLVARIGGDEFVVFLPNMTTTEVIEKKCSLLCQNLRKSYPTGDTDITVSASIGVAIYPQDGITYADLFANADTALYNAKFKGKDVYTFYTPDLVGENKHEVEEVELFNSPSFKENTIEYIFNLLYETRNVEATINMMLSLLGNYFKVSRAFIFGLNTGQNVATNDFEWDAPGIAPSSEVYSQGMVDVIMRLYKQLPYGVFTECNDASKLPVEEQPYLARAGVKAFLHCRIDDKYNKIGCVGFDDCKAPRLWTKKEHEVLSIFSKLLGSFLFNQTRIDELLEDNKMLNNIIDNEFAYVYVVNKQDFSILYMNKTLSKHYKEQLKQRKCYEMFFNGNRQCKVCPLRELYKNGTYAIPNVYNAIFDETLNINAFSIDWKNKADAMLVVAAICQEAD